MGKETTLRWVGCQKKKKRVRSRGDARPKLERQTDRQRETLGWKWQQDETKSRTERMAGCMERGAGRGGGHEREYLIVNIDDEKFHCCSRLTPRLKRSRRRIREVMGQSS